MSETLTDKEKIEYSRDVFKARKDPVWFMKDILGWKSIFPAQEKIVKDFYRNKYDKSLSEYKKLIIRAGQRSGKTVLGSKICAYEFMELITLDNPASHYGLMKNQPIAISCVAAGRDQALDGIFSLLRNDIEENEWFTQYFDLSITEGRIECNSSFVDGEKTSKNAFVQVKAAKADTGAGYTSKAVFFFDEIDLFQRTDSKIGAEMVYSKMVNSTQTLGINGKVIAISSTQYPDGMITRLYQSGLKERTTLTFNIPTWEMNPFIIKDELMEEYKFRMDAFWRDFANQPEVSGGLQFPEKVKLNKTIANVLQMDFNTLPNSIKRHRRVLAIDPAYKNDSFGVGCGYREGDYIIIDGVHKFQKDEYCGEEYILPSDIRTFIVGAINALNIDTFVYDTFITPELNEYVERELNVELIEHIVKKPDYDRWRELQEGNNNIKLDIVYNDFLEEECNQLVVTSTPTGKPKTDHTSYSTKDVADTVANCIWYLTSYEPEYSYTPLGPMVFV